jgi:hypothetical protein
MMKRFTIILAAILTLVRISNASSDPLYGYQQTWHFDTLANAAAKVGLHPGYQVIVDSNGSAPMRYTVWPPSTFTCSSPHCANGLTFQLADDYTINNSFVTSIAWANVTGKPTTLGGYGITDAVAQTLQIIVSGGGMTVNGAASTTLAGNVTFALDRGTAHASLPFYDDSRFADDRIACVLRNATGTVSGCASAAPVAGYLPIATDATHWTWQAPATASVTINTSGLLTGGATGSTFNLATPGYGTSAGTITQGNDARLGDDRTASGLRSATTVVSVSAATAPTTGQVLTASSGTVAAWVTPSGTTPDATTTTKGVVQLAGDACGSALSFGVCKINGASVPAAGSLTTGHVLQVTGASALGYGYVSNANVSSTAAISLSKLEVCGANQVVSSNGTADGCYPFSDTIHGSRSGGNEHALANASTAGFLTALGSTANAFLSTDGSGNQSFAVLPYVTASLRGVVPPITGPNIPLVSNSDGTGVGWGQIPWTTGISGFPTISTALPLTGGGSIASALSLGVNNATTTTTGVVALASDLGGTATSPTVLKVNGTSYPAGGALPSYAVPIVSGSSSVVYSLISNPAISSGANISVSKLEHGAAGYYLTSDGSTNSFTPLPYPLNAPSTIMTGSGTAGVFPVFTGSIGIGNSILSQPSSGAIRSTGEIQSTSSNTFRVVSGNYGFFTRNDGTSTSFQLTNSGDQYGGNNSLLPIVIDNAGGNVGIGSTPGTQKLKVNGSVLSMGEVATQNINSYRIVNGNYGEFWRSNGDDLYLLITNSGDQYGNFNALRPFTVHAASGNVGIGNYPDTYASLSAPNIQLTTNSGLHKVLMDSDGTGRADWIDLSTLGGLTRTDANTTTNKVTNYWYSGPTRVWDSEYEFTVATPTGGTPNGIPCGDWLSCSATYSDSTAPVTTSSMIRVEVSSSNTNIPCRQVFYAALMWGSGAWSISAAATENTSERIFCSGGLTTASISLGGGRSVVITLANSGPYAMLNARVRLFGSGREL